MTLSETPTPATSTPTPKKAVQPKRKRAPVKKTVAPPPTLDDARAFVLRLVKSKKGNSAMLTYIAGQLDSLSNLRGAIMHGFGVEILSTLDARLTEIEKLFEKK